MKVYKFWVSKKKFVTINNEEKEIQCYGGSNISLDDASMKAEEKLQKAQQIINGDISLPHEYEVEIREEILQNITEDAVITRNHYGAKVLNTSKLLILDIDKPKYSFGDIFRKTNIQQQKDKIFDMVRKLATSQKYENLGFRLYETAKGARVIVTGKDFDPVSYESTQLMKEFNCDKLYIKLCQKQQCFRARLTPKPVRIKIKSYKVKFPRETDITLENWLQNYEHQSQVFSTCKFVEQIGSYTSNSIVQFHDEISKAHSHLKLA